MAWCQLARPTIATSTRVPTIHSSPPVLRLVTCSTCNCEITVDPKNWTGGLGMMGAKVETEAEVSHGSTEQAQAQRSIQGQGVLRRVPNGSDLIGLLQ